MTYSATEISTELGSPVELYEFNYGLNYWRYTSAAETVQYLTRDFTPQTIQRGGIEDSGDPLKAVLKIKMFRNNPVPNLFRIQPPSAVVTVTVFRRHLADSAAEFVTLWAGRVLAVEFSGHWAELTCEPVFTSLKRTGLRLHYQNGCPHVLYGVGCNLLASNFEFSETNFTIDGNTVFAQSLQLQPDNYFAGGFIEYEHNTTGHTETRAIRTSSAGNLVLSLPPNGLAGASELLVHPGCDHTVTTCVNKFNNLNNYGGHPFIPSSNPFGGTRIF